jgi:hypothetical protein
MAIENAKPGTSVHRVTFASLLEERESARGVPLHALSALERNAKTRAPFSHASAADALEQRRCVRVVAKDVFTALQLACELVARRIVTRIAGGTQSLGLLISGVTGERRDASNDQQCETTGAAAQIVVRGDT